MYKDNNKALDWVISDLREVDSRALKDAKKIVVNLYVKINKMPRKTMEEIMKVYLDIPTIKKQVEDEYERLRKKYKKEMIVNNCLIDLSSLKGKLSTTQELNKLIELLKDGKSIRDIEKELEVPRSTIQRRVEFIREELSKKYIEIDI